MTSRNSFSNLSKESDLLLIEISKDSNRTVSYKVSRGVASIRTGGRDLIPNSGRAPEIWELALRELISARLISDIGYPDTYKLTYEGYQRAEELKNQVNNYHQGDDNPSASFVNKEKRGASKKIFVSYRRSDSADIAGRIYDRLVQAFDKSSIFKDVDSIPAGLDFRDVLDDALRKCDVFLAIIGVQWLEARNADGRRRIDDPRDFVRIEVESALERGIPVIPVLVQGTSMPSASVLPLGIRDLAYRNALPVRPDPDFHTDMDRLIRKL